VRVLLRTLSPQTIRACLWATGLAALVFAAIAWVGPAQPYQAPWAWISFIGMCAIDDFVLGPKEGSEVSELPKIALLAAVIVFRRHPELAVLVALVAAPIASLLKSQRPSTQVTAAAHWVLAAVAGAASFRLVGFEDTPHFLAATALLIVVFYVLGPLLSAWLESRFAATPFVNSFATHRRLAIALELAGAFLALGWRTSWLEPAALKVADGALVTLAGITVGFLLGGRSSRVFAPGPPVPVRPLLAAGAVLFTSELIPSPGSWLLPLGLAVGAGIWAARGRLLPIVCGAVGAMGNEIVRAVNAGRMPVDGQGAAASLGSRADNYVLAGPHTNFAWLDDRFHLPAPFPGIASAGDILIAIGMAWFVASLMLRPAPSSEETAVDVGESGESAALAA
jgi:uncharacterized protein DUF5317